MICLYICPSSIHNPSLFPSYFLFGVPGSPVVPIDVCFPLGRPPDHNVINLTFMVLFHRMAPMSRGYTFAEGHSTLHALNTRAIKY